MAGAPPGGQPVDRAVLGLTTAPTDDASRRRLCGEVAAGMAASEVWLADDAVTAHAGALSLGWGVSVTVGTGVACLAVPELGAPRIVGGHGFLLGDEGGAFWIGREGIRAVLRAHDGRGPRTALAERGRASASMASTTSVRGSTRSTGPSTRSRASLRTSSTAAESGDAVAMAIADEAVDELVLLVGPRRSHRSSPPTGSVPVALGGRLLAGGPLRRRLDGRWRDRCTTIAPRSADGSPLDGALLLGQADDPGRYRDLVHVYGARA